MAFTPGPSGLPSQSLEETGVPSIKHLKTQLHFDDDSLFGNESLLTKKQPVQVFLRIRPKNEQEERTGDASCLQVSSDNLLIAQAPEYSHTYKSNQKGLCVATQRFIFSHIYDGASSQKQLFHDGVVPIMADFFDGQNCLIFSYGVTNSGKTYTITGTSQEPGILPRALDVVFNTIAGKQFDGIAIKPKHYQEAVYLTEEQQEEETAVKKMLMAKAKELLHASQDKCGMYSASHESLTTSQSTAISSDSSVASDITGQGLGASCLDDLVVNESTAITLDTETGTCFSVWVSFAEIYSEFIYDLLDDSVQPNKQCSALKLSEDRHHNFFIKDLKEVKVESVEEAISLLRVGLHHRHTAETRLNYTSSRSHSVFTIKLLRVAQGYRRPKVTRVNRISIVDLAGSERSSKTNAKGVRIKEAGAINRSLHTLGRCIQAMRHNQRVRRESERKHVPFRESKLTQLLQGYFVGKGRSAREGRVMMFVNASDVGSSFDETIIVLKFSALASQVVPITKVPSASLLHVSVPSPMRLDRDDDATPVNPNRLSSTSHTQFWGEETELEQEDNSSFTAGLSSAAGKCSRCEELEERLAAVQAQLEQAIKTKKSEVQVALWEREVVIRQQVSQEFNQQIVELEERYTREIEEAEERIDTEMEKRMQNLQKSMKKQFSSKRRRVEYEDDRPDLVAQNAELEKELTELHETLQLQQEKAANELRELHQTHTTQMINLREQMNHTVIECGEAKVHSQQLEKQLLELQATKEEWLKEKEVLIGKWESQQSCLKAKLEEEIADREKMRKELEMYAQEQESQEKEKEELLLQMIGLESQLKAKEVNVAQQSQQEEPVSCYKQQLEESSATIVRLQDELRARSDQLEMVQKTLENEREEATTLKTEYVQFTEKKAIELEEVEGRLRSELVAKDTLFKEQLEVKAADAIRREEELKSKSEQLEALKEELAIEREEVVALKSRADQLTKAKASLASQVDDLMDEVAQTKRQCVRKNLEQAELHDSSRTLLEDEISMMKKKCALLEKEVEDRERQREDAIERKEQETLAIKEKLEAEVSSLRAESSHAEACIQKLSNTLAEVQENYTNELAQQKSALELTERRSDLADARIRELTENLATANEGHFQELAEQTKILQKSESRVQEMEEELASLKEQKRKVLHLVKDEEKRKMKEEFLREKAMLQEQIRFKEEELTRVQCECKEARVRETEAIKHSQEQAQALETTKQNFLLEMKRVQEQHHQELEQAQAQMHLAVKRTPGHEPQLADNEEKVGLRGEQRISSISKAISFVKPMPRSSTTSGSPQCLNTSYSSSPDHDSEHIYEEPPDQCPTDTLIYDSVDVSLSLQDEQQGSKNETSGRHLHVLERSSQLIDSFEDFEPNKRVIVYNPLKDAKQFKVHKKNTKRLGSETSTTIVADCSSETPVAAPPTRYMLRNRKKKRALEADDSDENTTPLSKLGKFFQPKSKEDVKRKKPVANRKKQRIRKSQISAPLETLDMDTPKSRLKSGAKIKIGGSVKPSTRQRSKF